MGRSPRGISSASPGPPCPHLEWDLSPIQPPQSHMVLLCAFEEPRKVKPLSHILTQRWTGATQEYGSLVTFPFLPAGA